MWVEASEDERFCERQVLAEGDQRTQDCGANDLLIAMGDGLKGFTRRSSWHSRRQRSKPALTSDHGSSRSLLKTVRQAPLIDSYAARFFLAMG
jgi:hypothetical protein